MSELERRLRDLPPEAFFPATHDISTAVEGRVASAVGRAPRPRLAAIARARPAWGAAALALVVAAAVMAASPDARSAVLRFFGLEGARIERREPSVPPERRDAPLRLGEKTTLAQARRRAGFEPVAPTLPALGVPEAVFFDSTAGAVSLTWTRRAGLTARRRGHGRALVLTQLRASVTPLIEKAAGPGTVIERVEVGGEPGFWLRGARHQFAYLEPSGEIREETTRLAGNTLLWERRGLLLRLEGARSKRAALAIARSAR